MNQIIVSLGALTISFAMTLPAHSDEKMDAVIAAELQAAIEAFGVSEEQAKKASVHAAATIEKKKHQMKTIKTC